MINPSIYQPAPAVIPARVRYAARKISSVRAVCAAILFLFCRTTVPLTGQTFQSIFSFNGIDGSNPLTPLIQGPDGDLYGTTPNGGAHSSGTAFKITRGGKLTVLYNFCAQTNCVDGASPRAGLTLGTDGNFYGVTSSGGAYNADPCFPSTGCGSVFRITPNGDLTTLYSFCSLTNCIDGLYPAAGLVLADDGNFYGVTLSGGAGANIGCLDANVNAGCGTVFEITPSGKLTTLYSFCAELNCADGANPWAALVQANNGNLYGTASQLGAYGSGTIFEITPRGKLTTLDSFCSQGQCGASIAALAEARDGTLYGAASGGGAPGFGTIFTVSPSGAFTLLYSFCPKGLEVCYQGGAPEGPLIQATDQNFYGTAATGGNSRCASYLTCGTVFRFTRSGELSRLHGFGNVDGNGPAGGVVQATDGKLYGTTTLGGTSSNCTYGCGTVFSVSVGLGPFVKIIPASDRTERQVIILGNNLSGTTSVAFNGTAATFKVVSDTEITATVPSGATTGTVEVTTPSRTLSSNVPFRVVP